MKIKACCDPVGDIVTISMEGKILMLLTSWEARALIEELNRVLMSEEVHEPIELRKGE